MENKLYKYELHCHTGCVSRCGRVEPEEIVKLYIEKGYDGIVVTDHYSPMTFEPNWCPQKQIDFYLSGYRRMKAEAEKSGGIDEGFLYSAGNLMKPWEKKIYSLCHSKGFLVFQAHTFRTGIRRCDEHYIDGIEIYNGKTNEKLNKKADFHTKAHTARGGIITKEKINNNCDLLRVLKSQNFEMIKTY